MNNNVTLWFNDLEDLKDYLNEDLSRVGDLEKREINFNRGNFENFIYDFGEIGDGEVLDKYKQKDDYPDLFLVIRYLLDEEKTDVENEVFVAKEVCEVSLENNGEKVNTLRLFR